jgi:hypothetical protein
MGKDIFILKGKRIMKVDTWTFSTNEVQMCYGHLDDTGIIGCDETVFRVTLSE